MCKVDTDGKDYVYLSDSYERTHALTRTHLAPLSCSDYTFTRQSIEVYYYPFPPPPTLTTRLCVTKLHGNLEQPRPPVDTNDLQVATG